MKVLIIGSRIPFPLHDGGAIATYNMLKGLSRNGVKLTYISLNTSKHFIDIETINKEFSFLKAIKTFQIDTSIRPIEAFKNLFSSLSYNIERFYNIDFENLIVNDILSHTYDIIHFEGLFVARYIDNIRSVCSIPLILRQHNVEYRIWERLAENEKNLLKKWYLRLLAKRIKVFEKGIITKFDKITTIATTDQEVMENWAGVKSIITIPCGFEIPKITSGELRSEIKNSIYHIGSMEWLPNKQAMEWFYFNVWPMVLKKVPDCSFYMAGKNMPAKYHEWESGNFHVTGEVLDASVFAGDKQILIVPLLSGSGLRIKTIEAMIAGKAVVTTRIGAQGLPIKNMEHCMQADDATDFAEALIYLLQNPQKRNEISENGKRLITANFANDIVTQQWINLYTSILGK